MKRIKAILSSFRHGKAIRTAKNAESCPIETCKLWGIPSLYDACPDLIGR